MIEAERDAFVEDKLACEHEKHIVRQERLLEATRKILEQKDLNSLLQTAADAAGELTNAKYAATGHGYVDGVFTARGVSRSEGTMPCPPGEAFNVEKGGIYLDLIQEKNSIRLTDAEMRSHPDWWDLPEGHVPLRSLLGTRLVDVNGQPNGLMMVTDKVGGGDFTAEDETILSQLAAIVSLALQHIEARRESEKEKRRLEALMKALPVGVSFSDDSTCQSITGNPAALAQFDIKPEDDLSASAPNGNAPGRQVCYFMDGRQITDAELPLQRAVDENREIPPVELEVELPSGRRWFSEVSGAPIFDAQGNMIGGVAVTVDITERKRMEDELKDINEKLEQSIIERSNELEAAYKSLMEQSRYFEAFFRHSITPIVFLDRDFNFIRVNDAYAEACQKEVGDFPGHNHFEFYPSDAKVIFDDVVRTKEPIKVVARPFVFLDHPDWGVTYWDWMLTPLLDDCGEVEFLVFSLEDVTLRKRAEMELEKYRKGLEDLVQERTFELESTTNQLLVEIAERKQAEEALQKQAALIDLSPDGIMTIQLNGAINFWSQGAQSLYGWTREEAIGQQVHMLLQTHFPQPLEQIIKQVQQTDYWSGELIHSTKDSRQVIVQSRWQAKFDDQCNVSEILESNVDITERKKAEESLHEAKDRLEIHVKERTEDLVEANARLQKEIAERKRAEEALKAAGTYNRSLIEASLDSLVTIGPDGKITDVNAATEAVTGHSREELIGTDFSNYFIEPGKARNGYQQVFKDGSIFDYALEIRRCDGYITPVLYNASVYRNEVGDIVGVFAAARDITERKRAEEELLKAKDAAEEAVRAKAAFLANMSHEIRTPMNSVIGFTELLLDEPESLSPERRENLDAIRINGHALLSIINDILDFSKMETDKLVLEDQSFNLRQRVEESLDLVSIKASEKGLNLAYTIDKGVPDIIICDPGRLRQVLGNLLSNAVKFTDKGEVKISVSSRQIDGTNEVHFAVQDTGIGIAQDCMNQLFQPFNQMEPSTTRLYGGTGLGLAISKKLVELMNGKIWAESQESVGSTFHFTIKASSEKVLPEPVIVSPQLIGKSVLIVVDNRTNRRLLSKQVYDWGMVPVPAGSGQEALSWIQRGDNFDIAILDMDLQDMDGLGLEEEMRKYNKTLPLVLLTSLGHDVPPNHAYLTKPIKPAKLYKVLTEILSGTDALPKGDVLSGQPAKSLAMATGVDQPIQNKPLRILLAEDNVSSQKVALMMLKKLGYRADVVANGIEVLQSLERQHYDIVLMDVRMPEMDGLEATRIIRQRWPDNGPKIVAITAYALQGDREKCLEAGMNDYIAKPIQKEDLERALREINRL